VRGPLAFIACLCGLTSLARAQPIPPPARRGPVGAQFALTAATGVPWGRVGQTDFYDPQDLGSVVSYTVDLGLHAGLRLGNRWSIGGYAEVGLPSPAYANGTGLSAFKAGIEGSLRTWFGPSHSIWTSLGAGYETLVLRNTGQTGDSVKGFELARLATGWEWSVLRWMAVGPYFLLSAGVYPWRTIKVPLHDGPVDSHSTTYDVSTRAHGWLLLGLAGHVGL
jgi:hypothetical protein